MPQDERRTWESAMGAVLGASLSVMAILLALIVFLNGQIERFDQQEHATALWRGLVAGAVVCFTTCGWCAIFSALFLNGTTVRSVKFHRRLIFLPMYGMLTAVTFGVLYWSRGSLVWGWQTLTSW